MWREAGPPSALLALSWGLQNLEKQVCCLQATQAAVFLLEKLERTRTDRQRDLPGSPS